MWSLIPHLAGSLNGVPFQIQQFKSRVCMNENNIQRRISKPGVKWKHVPSFMYYNLDFCCLWKSKRNHFPIWAIVIWSHQKGSPTHNWNEKKNGDDRLKITDNNERKSGNLGRLFGRHKMCLSWAFKSKWYNKSGQFLELLLWRR